MVAILSTAVPPPKPFQAVEAQVQEVVPVKLGCPGCYHAPLFQYRPRRKAQDVTEGLWCWCMRCHTLVDYGSLQRPARRELKRLFDRSRVGRRYA
jgi:hypothetical protein